MDKYIYFFGTIGGLIFVYLVLSNNSKGQASSLVSAGTSGGVSIIQALQGR